MKTDKCHNSSAFSDKETSEGKVLFHCHAGCAVDEICGAIGLQTADLFPQPASNASSWQLEYIYKSAEGRLLYKKIRGPEKQFYIMSWSSRGSLEKGLNCAERVLYKLPEVLEAKNQGKTIFLVEGEKDADRLARGGQVATTPVEGAGSLLREEYADQLVGCNVVVLYDEDTAGYKRRDQWQELLIGKVASVRVVKLPGLESRNKDGADISDWLGMGHTIEELQQLVETTVPLSSSHDNKEMGLVVVNLVEFLSKEIPQREMIMDPIIPSQGLSLLYSKRGVGKTFLSLAIGHAVATGTSLLKWSVEKPRKILFVDGEMPAILMQERLSHLVSGTGVELPDPDYFRLITPDFQDEGIPDISTRKGQKLLEEALGDAELLILDNLSTLTPSLQENEADAWAPIQTWLLKMRRKGVSVLLVHHAGKSGQQRGTSRREDALDSVLVLQHAGGYAASEGAAFEIQFQKARGFYGDASEPFMAQLQTSPDGGLVWIMKEVQDELFDEVVNKVKEGESYRNIAKKLEIKKSKVEAIVKKARANADLE